MWLGADVRMIVGISSMPKAARVVGDFSIVSISSTQMSSVTWATHGRPGADPLAAIAARSARPARWEYRESERQLLPPFPMLNSSGAKSTLDVSWLRVSPALG